jgi:hypothetical protein
MLENVLAFSDTLQMMSRVQLICVTALAKVDA